MTLVKASGRKTYRIKFRDHKGVARSIQGFPTKAASQALEWRLKQLADLTCAGAEIPPRSSTGCA